MPAFDTLNEDWPQACRRFDAFWEREDIDRACLQLYVPQPGPPAPPVSAADYWTDPAVFYACQEAGFRRTLYLAEAVPVVYSTYGGLPAMLGCEQALDEDTVWTRPCAASLDDLDIRLDLDSPVLTRMRAIVEHASRYGQGVCLVSFPADMGNRGDALAKMRGYRELMLDLAEDPGRVAELEGQVFDCWRQLYDLFYDLTRPYTEGTVTMWLPVWCRAAAVLVEADLIALVGPRHFRDVYLPSILAMIQSARRSLFHLDGPAAVRHLEPLLDIAQLDGIQWEPGATSHSATEWLPLLQRIQARGKCLWARCRPDEAEEMLANLSPRGLILSVGCPDVDTARGIIRLAERLARTTARHLAR